MTKILMQGGDGEEHHEDETQSEPKKRKVYTAEDFDNGIVESDVDLNDSYVVEPDNDPPQNMGNPCIKETEQNREAARLSESKAMDSISFGMSFWESLVVL
ncbi:hypothetical protein RD792_004781 [Penstemon davidsonii]|uniref:Uncharacterized protein n=1 Tax=Penstemon davidsonii TaxID=160366 RepID=A0ABR0DIA6_9LAMI|nr:hypothetical protein RD792_004781 [Penstemon davidsonii]